MKIIKNYMSILAVFALLFTSCSKEESVGLDIDASETAVLSFGAVLNDLANKSMNKSHFDQVPDCSDAAPAIAVIDFSYGGNDYSATVDILNEGGEFFTDYSEDLKIPVPANGFTTVTLTGFKVYDGVGAGNGTLIWIAPTGPGNFAGYVDSPLPKNFDVYPGTKPYIDVEVLCFDRRMVNEYGYVFFDILPETIYPFCLFVNYCNEDGRHWVADYSVDLYFGTDDTGIQLYDHNNPMAMAATGDYNANNDLPANYYADPLCLVVPGPPANLPNDQPYLYLIIYPEDWNGNYGDIDNTPVPVQLSWNMVNSLLNNDGTTNEYLHLLVGECDGAINGGGGCDPNDLQADCDNDGVPNGEDECRGEGVRGQVDLAGCPLPDPCDILANPTLDCDGDSIANGQDNCPEFYDPTNNCLTVVPCSIEDRAGCESGSTIGSTQKSAGDFIDIIDSNNNLIAIGTILENGNVSVSISPLFGQYIADYEIEISPLGQSSETECMTNIIKPSEGESGIVGQDFTINTANIYVIRIKVNSCDR